MRHTDGTAGTIGLPYSSGLEYVSIFCSVWDVGDPGLLVRLGLSVYGAPGRFCLHSGI